MRARLPFGQGGAIGAGKGVFGDFGRHLLHIGQGQLHHGRRARHLVAMNMRGFTRGRSGAVFIGADQAFKGFDARLAIHRKGVGPGPGCQGGGVDRHGLLIGRDGQVFLQPAPVDRRAGRGIGAIVLQRDIPPPFLGVIQPAIAQRIVQPRQQGGGFGHMHRGPAKGAFGKQPL